MTLRLAIKSPPSRPTIAILGVPFDNVTLPEALERIDQMIVSGNPHYVVTANVDFLVQAAEDVELRRILLDAHLVLCDGTPLVWVQDEPWNMGAWYCLNSRLPVLLDKRLPFSCVSRAESASPATGSHASHEFEQKLLLESAFKRG